MTAARRAHFPAGIGRQEPGIMRWPHAATSAEVSVVASPADIERMEFQLALRRRGITDQAVLRALDEVPREYFVAAASAECAYADQALPIACGQTISQPYVVAYMTERLELGAQH